MMSSWLTAAVQTRDGWRYALTTNGEQWPVMDGTPMMPRLFVNNLAIPLMIWHGPQVCQDWHFRARVLIVTFLVHPGAEHFSGAYFGQGNGFIFLDNVACNGNETSLISCSYTTPTSNASHTDDAGVRCPGQQSFVFMLFNCTDPQTFSCTMFIQKFSY